MPHGTLLHIILPHQRLKKKTVVNNAAVNRRYSHVYVTDPYGW